MGTCVIFCAGGFRAPVEPIDHTDCILAADGGLVHTAALGLTPTFILGDFDSLGYVPEGAVVHPVEKDDTDAMLAVRLGLELGRKRFVLYGAMDGPRIDHTLANFQTLQFLADHGAVGYLIGKNQMVTVVQNETVTFPTGTTGILSIFCLGADAEGVSLSGLKYNLENAALTAGFPLGVSNHFTTQEAKISVENGSLLLIYDRENGFPTRQRRDRL
jgi:thiamine pyrophosphokinase